MWIIDSSGEDMYNTDCLYRIMLDDEESVRNNVSPEDYFCDLVLCFNGALFRDSIKTNEKNAPTAYTVLETYTRVDYARYVLGRVGKFIK